jgi:hypothetical protein
LTVYQPIDPRRFIAVPPFQLKRGIIGTPKSFAHAALFLILGLCRRRSLGPFFSHGRDVVIAIPGELLASGSILSYSCEL